MNIFSNFYYEFLNGLKSFCGGFDGLFYTLTILICINLLSELMCNVIKKVFLLRICLKSIFRKILILLLVGIANMLDVHIFNYTQFLRNAVLLFYIYHTGISILQNATYLELPLPPKLKTAIDQLGDKTNTA